MQVKSPVLDAQGRTLYQIGGPNAWRMHDAGEYNVSMEWHENEPCMVLVAKSRPEFAFAICLSSIGKYATPEGGPNEEGLNELAKALPDFGKALERSELHRLLDIVLRYTPALIGMPPTPKAVREAQSGGAMLEITEKDKGSGKVLKEVTI